MIISKSRILFVLFLSTSLLDGCSKDQKKDETGAVASTLQPEEVSSGNIELTQHGDYSSLFVREENDCNVISANDVAQALQINPSNANKEEQQAGICRFTAVLESGAKVLVTARYFKIPVDHVKSEIKNGIEKPNFYQVNISNTGDTYLVTRGLGGQVQIFNTNYPGAVEIRAIESVEKGIPEHTEKSRKQRYEEVIKIANYAVTNHQK